MDFLEVLGWFLDHAFQILFAIASIYGGYKTWRLSRHDFWSKLREAGRALVTEAEVKFNSGEGTLKMDWVVDQLLEAFGSRFSFISKAKLKKIVEDLVTVMNLFKKSK